MFYLFFGFLIGLLVGGVGITLMEMFDKLFLHHRRCYPNPIYFPKWSQMIKSKRLAI